MLCCPLCTYTPERVIRVILDPIRISSAPLGKEWVQPNPMNMNRMFDISLDAERPIAPVLEDHRKLWDQRKFWNPPKAPACSDELLALLRSTGKLK